MNAKELIGKEAVRTAPIFYEKETLSMVMMGTTTKRVPDYSYCDTAILITNATDNHIIFKRKKFDGTYEERTNILDCRFCDNNWTDYKELINANVSVSIDEKGITIKHNDGSCTILCSNGFNKYPLKSI